MAEGSVVRRDAKVESCRLDLFPKPDVRGGSPSVEDDGLGAQGAQFSGQKVDRGDSPSSADAEDTLAPEFFVQRESPSQRADDVEAVSRIFPGQNLRAPSDGLEEDLHPAVLPGVDSDRPPEKGSGVGGDFDHQELSRPGLAGNSGSRDGKMRVVAGTGYRDDFGF